MSNSDTPWSSKVKALRDDAGLSYPEIAELTGMAPSTVGDLATGRSTEPKGMAAVKLHRLFEERCPNSTTTAA